MPREVFVAGQVLTAAELNVVSDQSVMVFAGTAARGSAIPSPSEGMVTYRSDDDVVEVFDGSVFAPVGVEPAILQVVSTTKTDTFSVSVAADAISGDVTGLTVSITPSSNSSKILITGYVAIQNADNINAVTVFKDGSALSAYSADASGNFRGASTSGQAAVNIGARGPDSVPLDFLDSPNTTSSITYSVRLSHGATNTQTIFVNRGLNEATDSARTHRTASTITVMEVAG